VVVITTVIEKLAKPFLKWAGGKGQLLAEIQVRLPQEIKAGQIDTYIEPFVGGGAVFFYIAQRYPAIEHFYLFDINEDLVRCYNAVKNNVASLVDELKSLQDKFTRKSLPERKDFYYQTRKDFNSDKDPAKLIFLNKTCFNGLYRVNKSGEFNVPFGHYKNPTICNEDNLRAASNLLQKAKIIHGGFEKSEKFITKKNFIYLDPPYRPLGPTANFTSYSKEDFTNQDQIRLADFCQQINKKGAKLLLSNSDPKNENPKDHFFENNYPTTLGFHIDRVEASRVINCKASGRGQIKELLITNY